MTQVLYAGLSGGNKIITSNKPYLHAISSMPLLVILTTDDLQASQNLNTIQTNESIPTATYTEWFEPR